MNIILISLEMDKSVKQYSKYGFYEIDEKLELFFPSVEVRISKDDDGNFSYLRKDSEGNMTEKIIPSISKKIKIEVAPIRPLNYPARRTNFVYLKFDKEVFLSEGTSTSFLVRCPVEVGIFIIHDSHKDSMDWFTCDPSSSRFGLYGSPDTGKLCKYYKVPIVKNEFDSELHLSCVMWVSFENLLERGYSITKAIFPITDHLLYYKGEKSQLDSLKVTLRKRMAVEYVETAEIRLTQTDWIQSPSWEKDTQTPSMEMGLE
ncbi:MAG: DUF432 domain-containing protein [Nitrosopumilus sp.]|nr:DUF432 domain-containing protein [Nitrosopumilus sp.]